MEKRCGCGFAIHLIAGHRGTSLLIGRLEPVLSSLHRDDTAATLLRPVSEHTTRPNFDQQAVQAVRPDVQKPAHLQCAAVAGTDLACKPITLGWTWHVAEKCAVGLALVVFQALGSLKNPAGIECGVTTIWTPYLPLSLPPAFTYPRISIERYC